MRVAAHNHGIQATAALEGVIMNTDINQEVIVGGDMNGHVGEVANGFHEAHGNFGYGTRNDDVAEVM